MLISLYIDNVAVIEHSDFMLKKGFNVMTGETGAGKSIIIDSINAILGERTSRELIRHGATSARVTALFSEPSQRVVTTMEELGVALEEDGNLLIQRELNADGKSICRINGRPVTASIVRSIGQHLINIHGQHENQALLSPQLHIHYIDSMGNLAPDLEEYRKIYAQAVALKKELMAMETDVSEKTRRMDLLRYQIEELEGAQLRVGEREELLEQKNRFLNMEKIASSITAAKEAISGGDASEGALQQLEQANEALKAICRFVPELQEVSDELQEVVYRTEDIAAGLREFSADEEFDPGTLETIEARLDEIYRLSLKYGNDEQEMLEYLEKSREELQKINVSDERKAELEEEYHACAVNARDHALRLSEKRRKTAEKFIDEVQKELTFLDMPSVRISVEQERTNLNSLGCDGIQFLIAPNPGEEMKPLAKIASGGELSRIMLAIKSVLADKDDIDTLIFDEVDTGISGKAAQKVGQKLHETANHRQVICVTHLAQIAAQADHHLLIEKRTVDGKANTQVRALSYDERKKELARIMNGGELTDLQLQTAEEMLRQAGNFPENVN